MSQPLLIVEPMRVDLVMQITDTMCTNVVNFLAPGILGIMTGSGICFIESIAFASFLQVTDKRPWYDYDKHALQLIRAVDIRVGQNHSTASLNSSCLMRRLWPTWGSFRPSTERLTWLWTNHRKVIAKYVTVSKLLWCHTVPYSMIHYGCFFCKSRPGPGARISYWFKLCL